MFKLKEDKRFWWPVKVDVPVDGRHATHKFQAHFLLLDQDEIDETLGGDYDDDDSADRDLLRKVLVDWKQVADEDGNAIEFSDEARDRLLRIPYVRVALVRAYFQAIAGRRKKNSSRSPRRGRPEKPQTTTSQRISPPLAPTRRSSTPGPGTPTTA